MANDNHLFPLTVELDAKAIIHLIKNCINVSHDCFNIIDDCKMLMSLLTVMKIKHCCPECNGAANFLAKEAASMEMDASFCNFLF